MYILPLTCIYVPAPCQVLVFPQELPPAHRCSSLISDCLSWVCTSPAAGDLTDPGQQVGQLGLPDMTNIPTFWFPSPPNIDDPMSAGSSHRWICCPFFIYYQQMAVMLCFRPRDVQLQVLSKSLSPYLLQGVASIPCPLPWTFQPHSSGHLDILVLSHSLYPSPTWQPRVASYKPSFIYFDLSCMRSSPKNTVVSSFLPHHPPPSSSVFN